MKRLGLFTGKTYDDNIDTSTIKECCYMIPKDKENDKEYLQKYFMKETQKCKTCWYPCEEKQKIMNILLEGGIQNY
jgi:hypothetical protein